MPQTPLSDEDAKDLKRKVRYTLAVLGGLLAVGMLSIFAGIGLRWASVGAALLWAFASLVLGGIVGFLFALPRVPRRDGKPRGGNSSSRGKLAAKADVSDETARMRAATGTLSLNASGNEEQDHDATVENASGEAESADGKDTDGRDEHDLDVNTNLQDISDWLTKMIVGVGLVELKSVPGYVTRLGKYVGNSLEPTLAGRSLESLQSTAAGITIYFAGLGFLCGYLLTRMFLSPAFLLADRATREGTRSALEAAFTALKKSKSAVEKSVTAITTSETAIAKIEPAMAQLTLDSEVNGALEELAKGKSRLPARIEQLIRSLSSRRKAFPLDRRLHIVLGRLYRYRLPDGDLTSALQTLNEFIQAKKQAGQRDRHLADALFNAACYYSLQLGSASGGANRETLDRIEKLGIDAIAESISINPENINDFGVDDDLKSLRETESGKKLLESHKENPPPQEAH